jgi:Protein of unknown function (DUF3108)
MANAVRNALIAASLALACAGGPARAQSVIEATYTIAVARIPVGAASMTARIGPGDYVISMSGRTGGLLRVLARGEGVMTATGAVIDGRLSPSRYTSRTTADDDTLDVTMTFQDGNVKELEASPPPEADRVPVTEEHRQHVVDPLSALAIPIGDGGMSQAACEHTLAIFDGRRRYDLKLAFKRMVEVKADKGYAGSAVECSVAVQPIAGHRPSSPLLKLLTGSRAIEMTFVPVAGTTVLAPFRFAIINLLGNITMQASRFETMPSQPTGQTQ